MKKVIVLLAIVFANYHGFCQKLTIDLSKGVNTTFTQTVDPQTYDEIVLDNRLLSSAVTYTVSVIKKSHKIAIIGFPYNTGGALGDRGVSDCDKLQKAIDKLSGETNEAQIPGEKADLISQIAAASAATCAPEIKAGNKLIPELTDSRKISPITLAPGDEIQVTVVRDDKNKWTYVYQTEAVNPWQVFYGFTYVPDVFTKFPNYYAKQQSGTDAGYIISQMNGNKKNLLQNISPTVMFTYRFFKNENEPFKFGVTGGFTYNTETLGALFGPSLVIGNGVTLNTGISFVQKYTLLGQYEAGQVIKDNLSFDQLHNKIWTYDLFISIGFNIPELFNKKSGSTAAATSN